MKTKFAREFVRVGRRRGWARAVIVKEPGANCYVVMTEIKAFRRLKDARGYLKDLYAAKV